MFILHRVNMQGGRERGLVMTEKLGSIDEIEGDGEDEEIQMAPILHRVVNTQRETERRLATTKHWEALMI